MHRVYVALGSNVGDRESYLRAAIDRLNAHAYVWVLRESSFVNTEAVSEEPQADYLNAVIEVDTQLDVFEFFALTQLIEQKLGRERKGEKAPRTLDLDLLFFDDVILANPALALPHPALHERLFVLEPLFELIPDFVHPQLQRSVRSLYHQLHEMAV